MSHQLLLLLLLAVVVVLLEDAGKYAPRTEQASQQARKPESENSRIGGTVATNYNTYPTNN